MWVRTVAWPGRRGGGWAMGFGSGRAWPVLTAPVCVLPEGPRLGGVGAVSPTALDWDETPPRKRPASCVTCLVEVAPCPACACCRSLVRQNETEP